MSAGHNIYYCNMYTTRNIISDYNKDLDLETYHLLIKCLFGEEF